MTHLRVFLIACALIFGTCVLAPSIALAQNPGTAFTYQGRHDLSGAPYTGTADLRFQLFKGADAKGAPIDRSNVQVTGGLFTVLLDFGQDIAAVNLFINGVPTFQQASVEISVRTPAGGAGPFTALTPRQVITPAPLAAGLVGLGRAGTSVADQFNFSENNTFQISAEVIQVVTPSRAGDVDLVELRLVNTAAAPQPVTLQLRQGSSTIIASSTAIAPVGTSFVSFTFPAGTSVSGGSVLRLVINTTNTLGVRYSTANPYSGGDANFLTGADLVFSVVFRAEGSFASSLPLQISNFSTDRLFSLTGGATNGYVTLAIENETGTFGAGRFQFRATGPGATEGASKLRIRPATGSNTAGLTMLSTGEVGVNVTAPLSRLHVDGDLRITGGAIIIPGTTRTLSIPAMAFHRQDLAMGVSLPTSANVSGTTAGQTVTMLAPLNLPDGANITSFQLHYIDNSSANSISATLLAAPKASSIVVGRANLTSSGAASTAIQTITLPATPSGVDNDADMFFVRVTWVTPAVTGDISFRGVTVQYQIAAPLP
ncbi:MAG: hypothetical protein K2X32_00675 [Phycisphaerales bacterium]|nr:hypothetical protein [Phycisphaerales bacterium]